MRIISIIFIILLMVSSISAETIESEILKFEHNRFYFSDGTEALILSGNNFEIIENARPVYSGKIEKSFEGISISYPLDTALEFDLNNLIAMLQTAEYDTINSITIGFYNRSLPALLNHRQYKDSLETTDAASNQNIEWQQLYNNYDDTQTMPDGVVSLSAENKLGEFAPIYDTISSPFGYLAVLMPNLSREVNRNGVLTTSLYYRFSDELLGHFYEGEILSADCLFPSDTACLRSYKYNHEKGRQLSEALVLRYPKLILSYNNPILKETAEYFADILARDRFDISVVFNDNNADLMVNLIPFRKSNPRFSLMRILSLLKANPALTEQQKENLEIISNRLISSNQTEDNQLKQYYWQLADYSLKYDFGLFPLFQPKIFFTYKKILQDVAFDEDGFIVFDQLKKIKTGGDQ